MQAVTLLLVIVLTISCSKEKTSASKQDVVVGDTITTASGLKYIVNRLGKGRKPARKTRVKMQYTGLLPDGTIFDSSLKRGKPYEFYVGAGIVIPAWDESVLDMTKGEKRTIIVPPALGYGDQGAGVIPPNTTLIFEMELLDF
jgi:peptidylprolyl isomerase